MGPRARGQGAGGRRTCAVAPDLGGGLAVVAPSQHVCSRREVGRDLDNVADRVVVVAALRPLQERREARLSREPLEDAGPVVVASAAVTAQRAGARHAGPADAARLARQTLVRGGVRVVGAGGAARAEAHARDGDSRPLAASGVRAFRDECAVHLRARLCVIPAARQGQAHGQPVWWGSLCGHAIQTAWWKRCHSIAKCMHRGGIREGTGNTVLWRSTRECCARTKVSWCRWKHSSVSFSVAGHRRYLPCDNKARETTRLTLPKILVLRI